MKGKFWKMIAGCAVVLLAMFTVFVLVNSVNRTNWIPVQASVVNTTIDFQNLGGPPEWVLLVEGNYTVDGRSYRSTPHRVASDEQREKMEATQQEWEIDAPLALYYAEHEPAVSSRYSDGGREGYAVAASLMTPMVLVVIFVTVVLVRRRSKSKA